MGKKKLDSFVETQPRFEDEPLNFRVVRFQKGTAVFFGPKGSSHLRPAALCEKLGIKCFKLDLYWYALFLCSALLLINTWQYKRGLTPLEPQSRLGTKLLQI